MKSISKHILVLILILFLIPSIHAKGGERVLRHVVMFKFSAQSKPERIKEIVNSFVALPKAIPQIKNFEWGTNNSPEKLNQGLTHCFILTFTSEKDRDAYLIHPAHKAFGKSLGSDLEKVTVVDFWVE